MRTTLKTDEFVVFDDVLTEEAWSQVWTYFQFEDLGVASKTAGAWPVQDGDVLAGPIFSQEPTETPVDAVIEKILATDLTQWVGSDWKHIAARAYVYPAGTSLGWHRDDHEYYSGAFIYYAHPEWNIDWGGELLIAEVEEPTALPLMPFRFENREYSEELMDAGHGSFILPRPNRLVVLRRPPHRIAPVHRAAGHAVRASLSGLLVEKDPD